MSSSAESTPESETEIRHLSLATQYELHDHIYVPTNSTDATASSKTDEAIIKSLQKVRKRLCKKVTKKQQQKPHGIGVFNWTFISPEICSPIGQGNIKKFWGDF